MKLFSKIWYWLVVMVVLILAAGITTLFPQTNDAPVSEETKPLDTTNKVDPVTKVDPQQEVHASSSPDVNIDPSDKVELQQLFNDLRKEYLDTRDGAINWWLQFIATVLAFFGIVIIVLGYFGIKSFKELEGEARKSVEEARKLVDEIKEHRTQSEAHLREMTSEDFDDLNGGRKVQEVVQDRQSDPISSPIDQLIFDAFELQLVGKNDDAIKKWRVIADTTESTDKVLAARAWLSIAHLLPVGDEQVDAYEKAMNLNPDYVQAYTNQRTAKYSSLSHEGIVIGAVLRYFNDSKFEKFSVGQEYGIESGRYRVDVALLDEGERFVAIAECKRIGYTGIRGIVQLEGFLRHSNTQFGLFAADTDPSKWSFWKLEDEMNEINRFQFETGIIKSESS